MTFNSIIRAGIVAAGVLVAASAGANASPLGLWMEQSERAAIEVTECGGGLCGRIVWLRDQNDKAGCNVQENCTIHMFPGVKVVLNTGAHIGHGAIIHGAMIGANCLVGMNAVLMDNVVLGEGCIVGALSFLPADSIWEARKVIVGNPARVVKDVSDEMLAWKTEGTKLYQQLPAELHATLKECEPLREVDKSRPPITARYSTWNERKNG